MSAHDAIRQHGLRLHPFEGYWRETDHRPGVFREGLRLLEAVEEAPWHALPARATYEVLEGGPLSLSVSKDGVTATGARLMPGSGATTVPGGAVRTLSCLGAFVLYRLRLEPDAALTDRELMPDDWFPEGV